MNINDFNPRSGRQLKENNQAVNIADMVEAIYKAIVEDKNAAVDVIDRSARLLGKASLTNVTHDRDVYVQGSLGDQETFVNALATGAFLLRYNPATQFWERFTGVMGTQLKESQVGLDQQITWANSDPANTQKNITFTKPDIVIDEYELVIYNPSIVTDLTIKVFAVEPALGGNARDALITTIPVLKSLVITGTTINAYTKLLHGIFNGCDCKLVISNDTALGAADGFSVYIRLREVM